MRTLPVIENSAPRPRAKNVHLPREGNFWKPHESSWRFPKPREGSGNFPSTAYVTRPLLTMTRQEDRLENSLSTKKIPVSNVRKMKSCFFSKNHCDLHSYVTESCFPLLNRPKMGLHFIRSRRPPRCSQNTKISATKIANFEKFLMKFKNSPKIYCCVFGHRRPTS